MTTSPSVVGVPKCRKKYIVNVCTNVTIVSKVPKCSLINIVYDSFSVSVLFVFGVGVFNFW